MTTIQKPVKKAIGKFFRLIDFQTYDHSAESSPNASDNESVDSNDRKSKSQSQFHIQMFGINETGETCSIVINDYQPFFYIKVGDNWDQNTVNALLLDIKQKMPYHKQSIISIKLIEQNKLYGFTGGKKSKFAMIVFSNIAAFNKTKNLWYSYDPETNQRKSTPYIYAKIKLQLYESNIPPILRYFHIQNISPSGWVFVHTNKCEKPEIKNTTCNYEYICSIKYVKPAPEKKH
jgi:hypothetical protein